MKKTDMKTCYFVFALISILGVLQESIGGRPFPALARPRPDDAAAFARWLVSQSSWGVLNVIFERTDPSIRLLLPWNNTISSETGGSPFGNVVSFSDGLPNKGKGIPYFYLTTLDPTARNALKDERSSFTISEYNLGTCGKTDPENPTCAKITLTGKDLCLGKLHYPWDLICEVINYSRSELSNLKLKALDGNSTEAELARTALFSKHPEMKGWPKDHHFQILKLDIRNIFMINWFGGPKPLTVDQYFGAKMVNLYAGQVRRHNREPFIMYT